MMKRSSKHPPERPQQPAGTPPISRPEHSELRRQGAKAAARGDKAATNPMDERRNLPEATGESSDTWQQRKDAWLQGHAAQSKTSDASTRSPESDGASKEEH